MSAKFHGRSSHLLSHTRRTDEKIAPDREMCCATLQKSSGTDFAKGCMEKAKACAMADVKPLAYLFSDRDLQLTERRYR
jgi:hypothetical protein